MVNGQLEHTAPVVLQLPANFVAPSVFTRMALEQFSKDFDPDYYELVKAEIDSTPQDGHLSKLKCTFKKKDDVVSNQWKQDKVVAELTVDKAKEYIEEIAKSSPIFAGNAAFDGPILFNWERAASFDLDTKEGEKTIVTVTAKVKFTVPGN